MTKERIHTTELEERGDVQSGIHEMEPLKIYTWTVAIHIYTILLRSFIMPWGYKRKVHRIRKRNGKIYSLWPVQSAYFPIFLK